MNTPSETISIIASKKTGRLLKKHLEDVQHHSRVLIKNHADTGNLGDPDLLIIELKQGVNDMMDLLKTIHDQLNGTPVLFIADKTSIPSFPDGSANRLICDFLDLSTEKHLLTNRIKNLLIAGSFNQQRKDQGIPHNQNEIDRLSETLRERTEQLGHELKDHLHTRFALQDKIKKIDEDNRFLEVLIDTIPNPVFIKNNELQYIKCNSAFREFLELPMDRILGKSAYDLLEPDLAANLNKIDEEVLADQQPKIVEGSYTKKDGSVMFYMLYKNVFRDENSGDLKLLGTLVDITSIRSTQKLIKVQHTIDYLSSLKKDIKHVYEIILKQIVEFDWVSAGGLYILDHEKNVLELQMQVGLPQTFTEKAQKYHAGMPQYEFVMSRKKYFGSYKGLLSEMNQPNVKQPFEKVAIIPLIDSDSDSVLGCLNLASNEKVKMTPEDRLLVESLSSRLAVLLSYARTQKELRELTNHLESRVEKRTQEVKETNEQLLKEISYHTETRKALEFSETLYRGIFENAQDGIVLFNAETFELVEANHRTYTELEYTFEEIANLSYADYVFYGSGLDPAKMIKKLFAEGAISFEAKHMTKSGQVKYRIINAKLIEMSGTRYILGNVHDITELTLKANELLDSREKYTHLQDNLPVGIFITRPGGEIEYVNKATLNMFGYDTFEEFKSREARDHFFNSRDRDQMVITLEKEGKISNFEFKFKKKGKGHFWGSVSLIASYDNAGKLLQIEGTVEDISIRKLAERELRKKNREIIDINKTLEKRIAEAIKDQQKNQNYLLNKSKLESLGELAAGIAHEINQPLGIMSLTFENLQKKFNANTIDSAYLEEKVSSILGNIDRIRDIINHIRIFSREQDAIILQKVNINAVIHDVTKLIKTQYQNHNITLSLDLYEKIGFTIGSKLKFEQVLLNLLSNAKFAVDENEFFLSETDFKKNIWIRTYIQNNKIKLEVEDNGIGIPPSKLDKIFDPFYTTKPEWVGTGLGLSIVYGIVKEMHGDIKVHSEEKKYTRFEIIFPRFPENE
ncbi:MAG: PAS domain S-box protein [Bacteroidales bacterium]|nr:PAS domain S-box protein [Bacteroidales bacterium]